MDLRIESPLSSLSAAAADAKLRRDTRAADLLFGSISGLVGKLVEYPFDTVKVRLQALPLDAAPHGRTLQCIRDMLAADGVRSFYRGISAPLVGSMVENAVLFIAYNHIQQSIRTLAAVRPVDPLSIQQLAIAGALSGAAVSFVLTPVELVKCRLQVQDSSSSDMPRIRSQHTAPPRIATAFASHPLLPSPFAASGQFPKNPFAIPSLACFATTAPIRGSKLMLAKHLAPTVSGGFGATGHLSEPPHSATAAQKPPVFRNSLSVITHTIRSDGILGLYRGHIGTLLREVAGGAAWFGSYEFVVRSLIDASPNAKSKEDLSPWWLMSAGAAAGISYNAALFPADVIKSRQQSLPKNESGSFYSVGRDLYRAEGIRGLYRGFGITIARSAPTSGIIFLTYELLSRNLTVEMD